MIKLSYHYCPFLYYHFFVICWVLSDVDGLKLQFNCKLTAIVTRFHLSQSVKEFQFKHTLQQSTLCVNMSLQEVLDEGTEPWGVMVERVEVKDVRVPEQLQRAMAAEAEAAREARAKVIFLKDFLMFQRFSRLKGYCSRR